MEKAMVPLTGPRSSWLCKYNIEGQELETLPSFLVSSLSAPLCPDEAAAGC